MAKNHTASAQNERREDEEDRETSIDHLVFTLNSSGSHITEACHRSERLHVRACPKDTGRTTQPTLISHEVHCPAPTFFHVVRVQRPCVQFTQTSFLESMTFRCKPLLSFPPSHLPLQAANLSFLSSGEILRAACVSIGGNPSSLPETFVVRNRAALQLLF